jgi:hypothetical protein
MISWVKHLDRIEQRKKNCEKLPQPRYVNDNWVNEWEVQKFWGLLNAISGDFLFWLTQMLLRVLFSKVGEVREIVVIQSAFYGRSQVELHQR